MAGGIFRWLRSSFSDFFITYTSVKEVEIHNKYIAILYRILQLIVFAYISVHIVWIEKGYQELQEPRGSSIIKVKGVARISIESSSSNADTVKRSLWDAAEYGIPPIENSAFFIATRKTVTYDQKQGICASALKDKLTCNSTYNPCKQGMPTPNAFGFLTGKCVPSLEDTTKSVCEINAWCPEELSNSTDYLINIADLQNFTVFIKTVVAFTQFNIKIRTVKDNTDFSCRFNSDTNRRCPIFSIDYILSKLQDHDGKIDLAALYYQGGLIEIQENWKCNFDFAKEKKGCFPTYTFHLLQSGHDALSPGINYRFAEKYMVNGIEYRTLTKIYGLRFVLSITGEGRQFDVVHLFVAIGSGIGYMVIAQIVCDFILMTFHKNREEYRQSKVTICHLNQYKKSDSIKLTMRDNPRLTSPLLLSHRIHDSETWNRFGFFLTGPVQLQNSFDEKTGRFVY